MVICCTDGTAEAYPTNVRQVCDITGAGDMVLATIGLGIADGMTLCDAARIANFAAGMEVERQGVAIITRRELMDAETRASNYAEAKSSSPNRQRSSGSKSDSGSLRSKLLDLEDAARTAAFHRSSGRTVVLTNGCFDLLHVGHVTYLQEAARLGDLFFVAVNSDSSVRQSKGSGRPVIPQHERAAMLAALSCVDHVLIFDEETPHRLLELIQPDLLVKGGTYSVDEVIGREVVEAYGGRVLVLGQVPGRSTSQIVATIRSR
jgi:D-beta-D-heptose 7-phosphate kinase/D-beta-D-heptose 1-phosphate adenosyltransferase